MKKSAIDWQAIHHQLDKARAAIEQVWSPTTEETQKILKARARVLAQEPLLEETRGDYIEIIEFDLAYERYALESQYVREIYPLDNLTPLSCTPAFVLGIVNVRGEILSVVDLKKFFDLPEKGLTDLNKVIIVQSHSMCFGILADAVICVRRLSSIAMQPSMPTLTGIREAYLKGITSERLVVLDAEKLLSDPRMVVREEVSN